MVDLKTKVEIYESLLHSLQAAYLTGNNARMSELLQRIDQWSYAHRVGNGEYTEEEQQAIIDRAFWALAGK